MKDLNGASQARVMVQSDLSCFGKCSLGVALPILSRLGCEAVALPTALLSTHTGGFEGYYKKDLSAEMRAVFAHWQSIGVKFDAVLTGYFTSVEQVRFAAEEVLPSVGEALRVVDPVMADDGKLYQGFDTSFLPAMRALCREADLITPNATEGALLCRMEPEEVLSGEKAEKCLDLLCEICPSAVLTGVRREGQIGYLAKDERGNTVSLFHPCLPLVQPGCGDVFAAGLVGRMVNGTNLFDAVRGAADFTEKAILKTQNGGHWYGLSFEDV